MARTASSHAATGHERPGEAADASAAVAECRAAIAENRALLMRLRHDPAYSGTSAGLIMNDGHLAELLRELQRTEADQKAIAAAVAAGIVIGESRRLRSVPGGRGKPAGRTA